MKEKLWVLDFLRQETIFPDIPGICFCGDDGGNGGDSNGGGDDSGQADDGEEESELTDEEIKELIETTGYEFDSNNDGVGGDGDGKVDLTNVEDLEDEYRLTGETDDQGNIWGEDNRWYDINSEGGQQALLDADQNILDIPKGTILKGQHGDVLNSSVWDGNDWIHIDSAEGAAIAGEIEVDGEILKWRGDTKGWMSDEQNIEYDNRPDKQIHHRWDNYAWNKELGAWTHFYRDVEGGVHWNQEAANQASEGVTRKGGEEVYTNGDWVSVWTDEGAKAAGVQRGETLAGFDGTERSGIVFDGEKWVDVNSLQGASVLGQLSDGAKWQDDGINMGWYTDEEWADFQQEGDANQLSEPDDGLIEEVDDTAGGPDPLLNETLPSEDQTDEEKIQGLLDDPNVVITGDPDPELNTDDTTTTEVDHNITDEDLINNLDSESDPDPTLTNPDVDPDPTVPDTDTNNPDPELDEEEPPPVVPADPTGGATDPNITGPEMEPPGTNEPPETDPGGDPELDNETVTVDDLDDLDDVVDDTSDTKETDPGGDPELDGEEEPPPPDDEPPPPDNDPPPPPDPADPDLAYYDMEAAINKAFRDTLNEDYYSGLGSGYETGFTDELTGAYDAALRSIYEGFKAQGRITEPELAEYKDPLDAAKEVEIGNLETLAGAYTQDQKTAAETRRANLVKALYGLDNQTDIDNFQFSVFGDDEYGTLTASPDPGDAPEFFTDFRQSEGSTITSPQPFATSRRYEPTRAFQNQRTGSRSISGSGSSRII